MEEKGVPSLIEIKRTLPAPCFRPSTQLSLLYVFRTLITSIALAFALSEYRLRYPIACWHSLLVYACYAYVQGTVFWGAFTIGHDCGHGSFSNNATLNWVVGNVMHAVLLTPYEHWRQSHQSHHKNTGNMERDEIFYPHPPRTHTAFIWFLGGAWFIYLITGNVPGRRHSVQIGDARFVTSTLSVVIVVCIIEKCIVDFGWSVVLLFYGAPLFVFATWLVVVTFLHHADCPWYTDASWSRVQGSLSSVDRDYGVLVNTLSHSIHLHQLHHLFPTIPHYRLKDATDAFKLAYPHLYRQRLGSNAFAFLGGVYNWMFENGSLDENGTFRYKAPPFFYSYALINGFRSISSLYSLRATGMRRDT